jgi:hypothetical protein
MTVVFINELSPAERTVPPEPKDLASRGLAPPDLPVLVFSPDASSRAPVDVNSEKAQDSLASAEAVGDQTQHALLYGRYLMQVQARIERAWMRPRSEIGAQRFSCLARIQQDRRGDVVGIKLDHCNGAERWQQSLLNAIRAASPLSAPPDPSVYADSLWLDFESEGVQPGGSSDGFEPENRETRVAADLSRARESFEHFGDRANRDLQSNGRDGTKVIHLTITGGGDGVFTQGGATSTPSPVPLPDVPPEPPSSRDRAPVEPEPARVEMR